MAVAAGRLDLIGTWQVRADGVSVQWTPAKVPGNIELDLLDAGKIPDPYVEANEKKVRWIYEKHWQWQRTFELAADGPELAADVVELVFDGIDTYADIQFNDHHIGSTESMMRQWRFNVRDLLVPGENTILVSIKSPARVGRGRVTKFGKVDSSPDGMAYQRKSQCHFGWDWAPYMPTSGMHRDVYLEYATQSQITDVHCTVHFGPDYKQAFVRVDAEFSHVRDMRGQVDFRYFRDDQQGQVQRDAYFIKGLDRHSHTFVIDDPHLWWPTGMGGQPLYVFSVTVRDGDGEQIARRTVSVGLREVELVTDSDEIGQSFGFRVNGQDVFCRGANWVPPDALSGQVTEEQIQHLLTQARDANMNMIRVWGGADYPPDVFYDTADRLGLLIWQDFTHACKPYTTVDWYVKELIAEVDFQVRRLRNHACVVLWCGNNEVQWLCHGKGKVDASRTTPADADDYGQRLWSHVIPREIQRLDTSRPYWPSSPYGGSNSEIEFEFNSPDVGDRHNWDMWHSGGPEEVNSDTSRFISEMGFIALPTWPTICQFLTPEQRTVDSPELWYHCKDGSGREKMMRSLEPAYGATDDLRQLCYLSQMLQADALRNAVHQYRHQKWHNRGALIWQYNDTWPAISWAMIDYFHRPKASWYTIRRAFKPMHVMLLVRDGVVRAYVVNDSMDKAKVTVEVGRIREGSHYQVDASENLTVEANAPAREFFSRPADQFNPVLDLLVTRLLVDGEVVAQDTLLLCPPKDFHWPAPRLSAQTELGRDMLTVSLTAHSLIYGLEVSAAGFDVRFNDNWLTLLPGETRQITVELLSGRATTRELANEMQLLAYQRGGFVVV